jgi:hypothetical protein
MALNPAGAPTPGFPPGIHTRASPDRLQHSGPTAHLQFLDGQGNPSPTKARGSSALTKPDTQGVNQTESRLSRLSVYLDVGGEGGMGETARPDMRCRSKKRSSQASLKECYLGTPFPRSALFLSTSVREPAEWYMFNIAQPLGYGRSIDKSNHAYLPMSKVLRLRPDFKPSQKNRSSQASCKPCHLGTPSPDLRCFYSPF